MQITTLIENSVQSSGFTGEHGLSLLIETTEGTKILFDTGQTGVFIKNAEKMNIDLSTVSGLVLSHGHYDHTGGIPAFTEINANATIYAKPQFSQPKFHGKRSIGLPFHKDLIIQRLQSVDTLTEIAPDIFAFPNIRLFYPEETQFENFTTQFNRQLITDTFEDELVVVIRHTDSISVITGCSHRGITNIIESVIGVFKQPICALIGGFHLKKTKKEVLEQIINRLENYDIKNLITGHCTGLDNYCKLKMSMPSKTHYAHSGFQLTF